MCLNYKKIKILIPFNQIEIGATLANKNKLGFIPGNMRDSFYVTEGISNENYLCTTFHEAGKK